MGDTGEGDDVVMLRGLGWVCLASDTPGTPSTRSGGLSLVPLVLDCDCREDILGSLPSCPVLPQTRRATGVTPPTAKGASSPQTCWAKCHRQPPELPPGPASLLLAVLRRLCAAEPRLCRVVPAPRHGPALMGLLRPFPSLLPPSPSSCLCLSKLPVPFSVLVLFCPLFFSPLPFLCPCPSVLAPALSALLRSLPGCPS